MKENKIKYEITCGPLGIPEKGEIKIPPEGSGRKDIEIGDFIISVKVTSKAMQEKVNNAIKEGKTELDDKNYDKNSKDNER